MWHKDLRWFTHLTTISGLAAAIRCLGGIKAQWKKLEGTGQA
jgi:hypothetical protein